MLFLFCNIWIVTITQFIFVWLQINDTNLFNIVVFFLQLLHNVLAQKATSAYKYEILPQITIYVRDICGNDIDWFL